MTETQNDPTEKQLYYFNKPIGEERWIRYTKENSLYENQYRVYTWLRRIGKCVICGDSFRGNNNSYCSQRCINDAAMLAVKVARLKKRTNAKTVCQSCGQAFTIAKSGRIRKFCSNKCRQRAYRVLRNAVSANLPQTALCNGLQVALASSYEMQLVAKCNKPHYVTTTRKTDPKLELMRQRDSLESMKPNHSTQETTTTATGTEITAGVQPCR